MLVGPLDSGDVAVFNSNAFPSSGSLDIGDFQSGSIGCVFFSGLSQESLKLFKLVLVDFLCESAHASYHESHQ